MSFGTRAAYLQGMAHSVTHPVNTAFPSVWCSSRDALIGEPSITWPVSRRPARRPEIRGTSVDRAPCPTLVGDTYLGDHTVREGLMSPCALPSE